MKKIITIIVIAMLSSVGFAQDVQPTPPTSIRKLPVFVICGTVQDIELKIKKFKEIPMVMGDANIDIPNGGNVQGTMRMYINPETGTYSLIYYFKAPFVPNDTGVQACVQAVGENIQPDLQGIEI